MVLTDDGDPVSSLTAVIVKASPKISKLYYAKSYQEGDDSAPDCFSTDGIRPDASVENPPCATCAICPKNQWGSRITDAGQKLKACSDSKRIAVVPYPDVTNDGNGPMLLRIPPASLQALAGLQKPLDQLKLPYQAVVVKIGFEHDAAYPKLTFKPVRAVEPQEAKVIRDHLASPELERMLSEPAREEVDEQKAKAAEPSLSERAAAKEKPKAEPKPAAKAETKPEPKAEPKPEPKPEPEAEPEKATAKQQAMDTGEVADIEDDEINSMLANILGD
jgi:hypothetical protein